MADLADFDASIPEDDLDSSLFGEGHPSGLPVFKAPVGAHLRNRRR